MVRQAHHERIVDSSPRTDSTSLRPHTLSQARYSVPFVVSPSVPFVVSLSNHELSTTLHPSPLSRMPAFELAHDILQRHFALAQQQREMK
jgi:hypothetical protein